MPETTAHDSTDSLPPAADDPLATLHRMSRTAGLGSGDYVAINVIAIAAVVLGLASALVIVDPLFIVLPVIGLVLSVIAIVQVRSSNGTQSGMLFAVAGLVLSLGFLAFKGGGQVVGAIRTREDRRQIESMIADLGKDLNNGSASALADAYSKFDSNFTNRVPSTQFTATFNSARNSKFFGVISSMTSNGQFAFETDPRSGELIGSTIGIIHLEKGDPNNSPRWQVVVRKEDGRWRIDGLPDAFPNAPPPPPGSHPPAPGPVPATVPPAQPIK